MLQHYVHTKHECDVLCCAKAAVSYPRASLCFWSWPGSATEMLLQWLVRAECPELGAGMCSECTLLCPRAGWGASGMLETTDLPYF